ncbi:unnamed protein product [Boreogadus saida]
MLVMLYPLVLDGTPRPGRYPQTWTVPPDPDGTPRPGRYPQTRTVPPDLDGTPRPPRYPQTSTVPPDLHGPGEARSSDALVQRNHNKDTDRDATPTSEPQVGSGLDPCLTLIKLGRFWHLSKTAALHFPPSIMYCWALQTFRQTQLWAEKNGGQQEPLVYRNLPIDTRPLAAASQLSYACQRHILAPVVRVD